MQDIIEVSQQEKELPTNNAHSYLDAGLRFTKIGSKELFASYFI